MTRYLRKLVEYLDAGLDCIPTYEDGRWMPGGWGCRLGLHRIWYAEEDR